MAKKSKGRPPEKKKERVAAFHPEFIEDLRYWVDTDRKVALRAFDLIEAVMREPFVGTLSRFCVSGDNQQPSLERRPDYATDPSRTA